MRNKRDCPQRGTKNKQTVIAKQEIWTKRFDDQNKLGQEI